jgi:hypothetical protein
VIDRAKVPTFPGEEGDEVILFLVDNGEPGDTDSWVGIVLGENPGGFCPLTVPQPGFPNERGNLVIHDATP